jgi:hypothetical protein
MRSLAVMKMRSVAATKMRSLAAVKMRSVAAMKMRAAAATKNCGLESGLELRRRGGKNEMRACASAKVTGNGGLV